MDLATAKPIALTVLKNADDLKHLNATADNTVLGVAKMIIKLHQEITHLKTWIPPQAVISIDINILAQGKSDIEIITAPDKTNHHFFPLPNDIHPYDINLDQTDTTVKPTLQQPFILFNYQGNQFYYEDTIHFGKLCDIQHDFFTNSVKKHDVTLSFEPNQPFHCLTGVSAEHLSIYTF